MTWFAKFLANIKVSCKPPEWNPIWSRNQSDCATGGQFTPKLTCIGYTVQCTPCPWDTALRPYIVDTMNIILKFWVDIKFPIYIRTCHEKWLNFNTKYGWCVACPRFAAQMSKSGSLGQPMIWVALSHYLVKTCAKTSYEELIRCNQWSKRGYRRGIVVDKS